MAAWSAALCGSIQPEQLDRCHGSLSLQFHPLSIGARMVGAQRANFSGLSDQPMNQPVELTVMMYHYVRDPGDEAEAGSGILGMPVRTFEAQLDELSRQHRFITWPDVRMALQEDRPLPGSACLLTFDDGLL